MNKTVRMIFCVAMLQTAALFSAADSERRQLTERLFVWVLNKSVWYSGDIAVDGFDSTGKPEYFAVGAVGAKIDPYFNNVKPGGIPFPITEEEYDRGGLGRSGSFKSGGLARDGKVKYGMKGSLIVHRGELSYDELKKAAGDPTVIERKDNKGAVHMVAVYGALITFDIGYLRNFEVSLSSASLPPVNFDANKYKIFSPIKPAASAALSPVSGK